MSLKVKLSPAVLQYEAIYVWKYGLLLLLFENNLQGSVYNNQSSIASPNQFTASVVIQIKNSCR